MKEKLEMLFKLRDYYYEDPSTIDEDELINTIKKLEIKIPDFIVDKSNEKTCLFVCPDTEYEFPFVFEFSESNLKKGIEVTYNAIKEYYSYSEFYDGYTDICINELLKLFLYSENVPVVRFFDTQDVELLNVRKLNLEI